MFKIFLCYIFFFFHLLFMCLSMFGWLIHPYFLLLDIIVISSWYINNNNCLLTQIEFYFFNRTIIGNNKFKIPFKHRILLYISFSIGVFCNIIYLYI